MCVFICQARKKVLTPKEDKRKKEEAPWEVLTIDSKK